MHCAFTYWLNGSSSCNNYLITKNVLHRHINCFNFYTHSSNSSSRGRSSRNSSGSSSSSSDVGGIIDN